MCCLFGLLDYGNTFTAKNKNLILTVLSKECEIRGTDATGIAYNSHGRLSVYKRPVPAHRLRYAVPESARYIMGHTRMTTQGNEKRNYNNHPFAGTVASGHFALAHNGILHNDERLRKKESLPSTKIQTDSYIAVQLLEQQKTLNFDSLKHMAEKVEGSFTFTVLDSRDNLYVVRGNNPFALYHFPDQEFYLYASTDDILKKAIEKLGIQKWNREDISLSIGDILRIDRKGKLTHESFDATELYLAWEQMSWYTQRFPSAYRSIPVYGQGIGISATETERSYLQELKDIAACHGLLSEDIDNLLRDGFTYDEIEEMLYTDFV